MKNRKTIVCAIIIAMCSLAALTSCGGNNVSGNTPDNDGERVTTGTTNEQKEENNGIVDGIESAVEDIGSDIKDSVSNPEEATHGKDQEITPDANALPKGKNVIRDSTKGSEGMMDQENGATHHSAPKHRAPTPAGK